MHAEMQRELKTDTRCEPASSAWSHRSDRIMSDSSQRPVPAAICPLLYSIMKVLRMEK